MKAMFLLLLFPLFLCLRQLDHVKVEVEVYHTMYAVH